MNLRMKQKTPTKPTNEWMKNCTKWHLFKYRCYDTTGNHTRISYQKKKYGWINSKSNNRNELTKLVDGAKIRMKLREWKQSTVMHLLYQLNLLHTYVYINVAEIHKIVHIKMPEHWVAFWQFPTQTISMEAIIDSFTFSQNHSIINIVLCTIFFYTMQFQMCFQCEWHPFLSPHKETRKWKKKKL